MSSPRSARARSILAALSAGLAIATVVACAQGTSGSDDDGETRVDARRIDARTGVDARNADAMTVVVDARPVDAGLPGIDSGLPGGMCTQNADCTSPGECCVFGLLCAPGTPAPPPINCLPN